MDMKVDNKSVIVLDLDDTLYNEIEFLKSAYMEIARGLEKHNHLPLYAKMISLYRSQKDVFGILADYYQVSKSGLISKYRQHQPKIKLFDGAKELLENIKKYNGKIGIITDGRTQTQTAKIKALGIASYLDHIVISEEIGTEKPHPNNYKEMENTFGEGSYSYIADNFKKDFITPNILGWDTVGLIDNGLNIHTENHLYFNKEHEPKKYVSSLGEINIVAR